MPGRQIPIDPFVRMTFRRRQQSPVQASQDDRGFLSLIHAFMLRRGAVELLFLMSIIGLGGCSMAWPSDRQTALLDNHQFMEAWNTYLHCRSSSEPEEIGTDLQQLNRIAHTATKQKDVPVPLPAAIRRLITAPPSRLAVDPRSMAAACALHGGLVAQSAGQFALSVELLTAVTAVRDGSEYDYYAVEAGRRLMRMQEETPIAAVELTGLTVRGVLR